MLNYIWAGLLGFALLFAIVSDVQDLRADKYANGKALPIGVRFHDPADFDRREATVSVVIDPTEYAGHFHVGESIPIEIPATLMRSEDGNLLRFATATPLPPRLAAMRDVNDSKLLSAKVENLTPPQNGLAAATLRFDAVRFVKLRAMTAAGIDMAGTAVKLALELTGVLALWLGLMKIGEAAGLIDLMVKVIQPILHPLFPKVPRNHPAMGYIAINLAGNILGLGNATTAMGLKAMEELQKLNPSDDTATDPMVMLLAIHTAAFQLGPPATVVALMGFAAMQVFVPMLLVGLIATVIAIVATKLLGRLPMYRRTDPELLRGPRAEVAQ
jgi:spore maturation protein A